MESSKTVSNASSITGVIYDVQMLEHKCLWENHPERPERFSAVIERCEKLGLLSRCKMLTSRLATEVEILSAHTPDHFKKLQSVCDKRPVCGPTELEKTSSNYDSVYFHPSTYDVARLACGSAIELTKNVLNGTVQNGMAIVRPPGHHAMESEFCGYCFFNNVAVAAKQALESKLAQKILIVDFDVHHGQGTQQMFYNDPRVLYFSTHRYEHGRFWPNLKESNYNWIGDGDGIGFNCNVPLNTTGMGNTEFLTIWHQLLLPIAYQFNPDLVLVSAGYDSALNDPKGGMQITPQCYPHLISPLMGLADGKVAVILEGGYCLKALAEGAALTLRTLLGDPCPTIGPVLKPMPELVDSVLNSFATLSKYWDLGATRLIKSETKKAPNHVPELKYEWTETTPDKYPTRNPNPVESFEFSSPFDFLLDELIRTTDLAVAKYRCGITIGHHQVEENSSELEFLDQLEHVFQLENLSKMTEKIMNGGCQSGIAFTEIGRFVKRFLDDDHGGKLKRILVLNLEGYDEFESTLNRDNQPEILRISLCKYREVENVRPKNGLNIEIFEKSLSLEWEEVLMAVTNVILPVAYEFSPELVIITGTSPFSPQIIHLLKPLANGKILLIMDQDLKNKIYWINSCLGALLGQSIPRLSLAKRQINDVAYASICDTLDHCSKYWTTIKPFRTLVDKIN